MGENRATASSDARRWNSIAERLHDGLWMDPVLAEHYRQVHLEMCARWAPSTTPRRILKTDVFAEAVCPQRAFSWDMANDGQLVAFDISAHLTTQARMHASTLGRADTVYMVADARRLPFADDTFDLIVSDSTLDHFRDTCDIAVALRELARVLRTGGTLIITLDNPRNLTQPLMKLWLRLGWAPFFIGRTLPRKALVIALEDAHLRVTESAALLHHLRFFTKSSLHMMRRVIPHRAERIGRAMLRMTEALGRLPTREQTALFVAACAIKPTTTRCERALPEQPHGSHAQ
ncbi:MAG: methyltransferase domain-containing protein [Chloroflexota bacterium]